MAILTPREIQNILDAEDRDIENFVLKIKNRIERQLNKAVKNLEGKNNLLEITEELSKLSALNLPDDIQKEIDSYVTLYQKSIKTIAENIQAVNNVDRVFNTADQAVIDQLFDFSKSRLIASIDETYAQFKSVAYQGVVSRQLPDLTEVTKSLADTLEGRLPAEINTQLAGFQRTVTLNKADELELTHFLYAGGLIKTSRPFCQERAGNIYSFDEAKSWDNGQGLPVIPYLGGWNCRHSIVPMTRQKAIDEGWSG